MTPLEIRALDQYILRHCVPIVSTQTADGLAAIHGSGVFYDHDGRLFLLTAAHLYERGTDLMQFAIPLSPTSPEIWTLGSFDRHAPIEDDQFDIMALEIFSAEVAVKVRAGWGVLESRHVGLCSPAPGLSFILSGYPHALARGTDEWLIGTPVSIYTAMLPAVPANADRPTDPGVDQFYLCDDSAETIQGRAVSVPALEGMSGGPVWQLREPGPDEAWAPETLLRLVGLISRYRSGEYARAKSWAVAAQILATLDEERARGALP